ncbi:hypothetical protein SO802_033306 [Lithocarpus litseifolius]|uniref:Methenyltetrahydrofolate cyclohydrolase n=1 Tax=Lithocarpus litseifolius TaxID=425828 RepID=A0AAW2BCT8_9ROSI
MGLTGYVGTLPALSSIKLQSVRTHIFLPQNLFTPSSIRVEAGQDAVIRALLYEGAHEIVLPYGKTVAEFVNRTAELKNRQANNCGIKDEGIIVPQSLGAENRTNSNILSANTDSLSYARTPPEILRSMELVVRTSLMSDHKANIIDGKAIAQTIRNEIASEVHHLSNKHGKVPGLAVVIVGNRKDSQSYVSMKRKACAEVGIKSFDIDLPEQVSEADLVAKVHELNANPDVHGILVQLPLPKHINEERILTEISIEKDVDGFNPLNIGKLAMKGREPLFHPCTPKGCLELLSRSGITIKGKKVVVVGRSNIVGLPVSLLLLKADATVTIVHSHSQNPERIIRDADIIIAAAGQAKMVKGSWIKPGAAVIDVGTNAIDDPSKKSGYRLVGDVDFQEACKVAGWITPVPGGVGPMTVAMLLKNTLEGAKRVIEH